MAEKEARKTPRPRVQSDESPTVNDAAKPARLLRSFFGMLASKTKKVATIEEINEAAARGWAGEVKLHD